MRRKNASISLNDDVSDLVSDSILIGFLFSKISFLCVSCARVSMKKNDLTIHDEPSNLLMRVIHHRVVLMLRHLVYRLIRVEKVF